MQLYSIGSMVAWVYLPTRNGWFFVVFMYSKYTIVPCILWVLKSSRFSISTSFNKCFYGSHPPFFLGREDGDVSLEGCISRFVIWMWWRIQFFDCIFFSEKKTSAFFATDLRGSLQVGRSGDVSKISGKKTTPIMNLRQLEVLRSYSRWCFQACLFTKKIVEGEDVPCWRTCVLSFDSLGGQQNDTWSWTSHEILSCTYTGLLGYNPSYGKWLCNPITSTTLSMCS